MIYPQTVSQPDQNSDFYTTGLAPANQRRNLDALNLKIALDHAAAEIAVFPVIVVQGPDGTMEEKASDQRMEGLCHNRS